MNNLNGKIIISTQPEAQKLQSILDEKNAKLIHFPTIKIEQQEITEEIKAKLKDISSFDFLFFTSKNGVKYLFRVLEDLKAALPKKTKTAAIGKATAELLNEYGFPPKIINKGNTSADFIEYLKSEPELISGKRILLCLGNLAGNNITEGLSFLADFERINVYKTIRPPDFKPEIISIIKNKKYDWLIFTSPSTFENFLNIFKPDNFSDFKNIASIGNVTSDFIKSKGFKPTVTAKKSTINDLINDIENQI